MANPDHVAKLKEGVQAWNEWREANPEIKPDLDSTDFTTDEFRYSDLYGDDDGHRFINLRRANLKEASLVDANLEGARLEDSKLQGSILKRTNLRAAKLTRAKLHKARLLKADLRGADLAWANLQEAILSTASEFLRHRFTQEDLQGEDLWAADLRRAILLGADLSGADLSRVDLRDADLSKADLRGADLRGANLEGGNVTGVKFDRSSLQRNFQGIRVATCYGSQVFKSFAQDQDFIEEFRSARPRLFRLWWITADCGRSFIRWAALSLVLAALFGIIYYWMGPGHIKPDAPLPFSFVTMVYYSVVTFTTLGFGDVKPQTELAAIIVMIEVIIGYVMLGGLISIFANKVARRS